MSDRARVGVGVKARVGGRVKGQGSRGVRVKREFPCPNVRDSLMNKKKKFIKKAQS